MAVSVAGVLTGSACGGLDDVDASDELHDFAETTTTASSDPYEQYLGVTGAAGIDPMDPRAAEARSTELCFAGPTPPDPSSWSANDMALIRSYCPEVELEAGN